MNFSGLSDEEIIEQQRFADELFEKYEISLEDYLNTLISQKGQCGLCSKSESEFEGVFDVHKQTLQAGSFILACPECSIPLNWARDNQDAFKKLIAMHEPKKEKSRKVRIEALNSQFPTELGF